ncbi:MAG: AAA family ATPase [Clostridiales bacterium]|jgi:predicted AAA+ superfamily ATPase|nr:AAA family ATPase [Clostridiales bacterium]
MHYDFKRNIYQSLLNWKEGGKGLLLRGPRQVGKTYILEKFGKEEYKNLLYINLGNNDNLNWFKNRESAPANQSWGGLFEDFCSHMNREPFKMKNRPSCF